MIVQLKVPDELYELYAKRNPGNPRKAMEEALEAFKVLEPGIPRLILENPELREIKRLSGEQLPDAQALLAYIKKTQAVSLGGVEIELNLGQRQRLEAMAEFFKQPYDQYAKQQLADGVQRVLGV